ncbi:NAD-P-binding protein [Peniophora sp. CONT]|nr:NAD-P-binding protein [Peniophora sp. CONT]
MSELPNFKGLDETLPVTTHHAVYPGIDPTQHFTNKTYAGKVVLVTGGSRGIGASAATHYARAGASVAVVARSADTLEEVRAAIVKETPGAQVLTFAVDVKDSAAAERAVEETVKHFGKLDVLVANAGAFLPFEKRIGERDDPLNWWHGFEVNIFGVYNFVRPALKHLEKSEGYVVVVSTVTAQLRIPTASDYGVSKHALGRLVEYIALEYPTTKAFAVHPGAVNTVSARGSGLDMAWFTDPTELSSGTFLALTSGKYDWLSGRFYDSTWDIDEVAKLKEKILEKDALVSKLVVKLD